MVLHPGQVDRAERALLALVWPEMTGGGVSPGNRSSNGLFPRAHTTRRRNDLVRPAAVHYRCRLDFQRVGGQGLLGRPYVSTTIGHDFSIDHRSYYADDTNTLYEACSSSQNNKRTTTKKNGTQSQMGMFRLFYRLFFSDRLGAALQ